MVFLTTEQPLYICPYITNSTTHLCTILSNTEKQLHLFLEPESAYQVEFNYAVSVLKDNMKDYDITKTKMVISYTHRTFQFMCTL
jgi:hypothetical protein